MARNGSSKYEAIRFAAGTATFMACLGRATVVSVFVHWRVWVFLTLNLLLLAILFTSKSQVPSCQTTSTSLVLPKRKRMKRRMVLATSTQNYGGETIISLNVTPVENIHQQQQQQEVKCNGDDKEEKAKKEEEEEEEDQLSEEELHQRAEAFIAMFRQQLVSDASKTRAMT